MDRVAVRGGVDSLKKGRTPNQLGATRSALRLTVHRDLPGKEPPWEGIWVGGGRPEEGLIGGPTTCSVFSSRGTDEHPGLRRRELGGPGGSRSRKRPQPGAPIDMVTDGNRGTGLGPGPGPSEIPSTLKFTEFC